jgi:hypothetical protein
MEARCMKCKSQKEMVDAVMTKTSRGGYMVKGKCKECGCGMCRIMSEADANKEMAAGMKKEF